MTAPAPRAAVAEEAAVPSFPHSPEPQKFEGTGCGGRVSTLRDQVLGLKGGFLKALTL